MRPPEEAVEAAERLEATMTEAKAATPTMAATAAAQAGAAAVTHRMWRASGLVHRSESVECL